MKAICPFLLLLLFVACSTSRTPPGSEREGFVASDVATDAQRQPRPGPKREGLSTEQEGNAALLLARLERAQDETERNALLHELIGLGPDYLQFLRSIQQESIRLDVLYVIRCIEREHSIRVEPDSSPTEIIASGGEAPNPFEAPAGHGYNREHVERWLEDQLQRARAELDAGRHENAARIADAALLLMPDTRLRAEFDTLATRARGEVGAELLIAGTMSLEPRFLQYARAEHGALFAQPLQIRCYLKNVSSRRITLRINEGPSRESVLVLSVRYEQTDYLQSVYAQIATVRLPIEGQGSVTLEPNESYELTVPLASFTSLDADAPLKMALGRAEIQASLRVFGASDESGRGIVLRPVQFARQNIVIFPARFELDSVLDRPLPALREYINTSRAQEIFLAAHTIDQRNRRPAADLLTADDFETGSIALQRARLRALQVVFSRGATWDIRQWRQWWADERLRH